MDVKDGDSHFRVKLTRSYHIMAVVGESAVLFVAYKLVLMRHAARNRKVIAVTTLALLAFVVKYCFVC